MTKKILTLLLLLITIGCSPDPATYQLPAIASEVTPEMVKTKYLLNVRTKSSFTTIFINDIELFNNYRYKSGTISTGLNVTAYLENGENELGLYFIAHNSNERSRIHKKGALTEAILTAAFPDHSVELTSITASADENGNPTSAISKEYPSKHRTTDVKELGYKSESSYAYKMQRKIVLQNIPDWAWTNAAPLVDSPETFKKLQDAYIKLGLMLANNDLESFKKAVWLSMEECAAAEGLSPEFYFESTGMPQEFDQGMSSASVDWSKYKIKLYKGGRLARLENSTRSCPLLYTASNGKVYGYNCFFSLIDGQLIVSR